MKLFWLLISILGRLSYSSRSETAKSCKGNTSQWARRYSPSHSIDVVADCVRKIESLLRTEETASAGAVYAVRQKYEQLKAHMRQERTEHTAELQRLATQIESAHRENELLHEQMATLDAGARDAQEQLTRKVNKLKLSLQEQQNAYEAKLVEQERAAEMRARELKSRAERLLQDQQVCEFYAALSCRLYVLDRAVFLAAVMCLFDGAFRRWPNHARMRLQRP